MKLMKRIFAFSLMLCLLFLCVCPTTALAASYKGKTQKFLIRRSSSYNSTGVWVTMTSTSTDGKTGTIRFDGTLTLTWLGSKFKIPAGCIYDYKINSLKEGGKITLTWQGAKLKNLDYAPTTSVLYDLTAKIHVNSSKGCKIANIWKLDTMRYNGGALACGMKIYMRNN